jgi:hypothetical protein
MIKHEKLILKNNKECDFIIIGVKEERFNLDDPIDEDILNKLSCSVVYH